MKKNLLLLIVCQFCFIAAFSQKVIDYPPKIVIICKDADTRKLIGGVKVLITRNDTLLKTIATDGCGRCLLLKPKPGSYSFILTKTSYYTFKLARVDVPADQTITLEVPLDELPNKSKGKLLAME